jgi:phosphatidylglycerophosphate synthase
MHTMNLLQWLGYLICGGFIALVVLNMPKCFLLKLGCYITPNIMSIIHAPIVWIGFYAYSLGFILIGFITVAFGALLDRIDGRLAKVFDVEIGKYLLPHNVFIRVINTKQFDSTLQAAIAKRDIVRMSIAGKIFYVTIPKTFWQAIWYPGGSKLGKVIDPAMDKVAVLPIYMWVAYLWITNPCQAPLCHLYLIGVVVIGLILLTEICGTLIRLDCFKKMGLIKGKGATWAGKIKALSQWLWLILFIIEDQKMLPNYETYLITALDFFLIGIFILAVISLVSKMFPVKEEWGEIFKHNGD